MFHSFAGSSFIHGMYSRQHLGTMAETLRCLRMILDLGTLAVVGW